MGCFKEMEKKEKGLYSRFVDGQYITYELIECQYSYGKFSINLRANAGITRQAQSDEGAEGMVGYMHLLCDINYFYL